MQKYNWTVQHLCRVFMLSVWLKHHGSGIWNGDFLALLGIGVYLRFGEVSGWGYKKCGGRGKRLARGQF